MEGEKKRFDMMGVTFNGDVTFNGPMFDIHDNEHVHIYGSATPSPARKGKTQTTFAQFIIDTPTRDATLARLHELIDGKTPKLCALTILAACQNGILTQPSYQALASEFPEIGDRKNWSYYLSRTDNYTADIKSIATGL